MLTGLRALLAPPVFEDEEQTRRASLLNILALASVAINGLGGIGNIVTSNARPAMILLTIGGIALQVLILFLVRRQRIQLAGWLLCLGFWGSVTVFTLFLGGGISSPNLGFYALIIIAAGLILGGRASISFTALCFASVIVTFYLGTNGALPQVVQELTPTSRLIVQLTLIAAAGVLVYLVLDNINTALARARRNELAQAQANRELQTIRATLEQRVADLERTERLLHDSEELYQTLVENLPQSIFCKDRDGHFTFANQRYCAGVGKTRAEILGKTDFDFHPPELAEKYRADDQRIMESRETLEMTEERQVLGGEKQYVQIVKFPTYNSEGQVIGIQGIFWDVTARKRAEIVLQQSHDELERLVEQRTTAWQTANRKLQAEIGERMRAEQELIQRNHELKSLNQIGRALSRLAGSAEILEEIYAAIGLVLNNRNLYIALYDEEKKHISFPIYTVDGKRRADTGERHLGNGLTEFILKTNAPLLIAENLSAALAERGVATLGRAARCFLGVPISVGDKVLGVIAVQDYEHEHVFTNQHLELLSTLAAQAGIALENARLYAAIRQELAERQRAEEALAQEHGLLRTILDVVPDYIYVKDRESRYILSNPAHLRSLGVQNMDQALGKTAFDFFPAEYAQQYRTDEERIFQSGQPVISREERGWNRATGVAKWHLTTKVPLIDAQGQTSGLVGITHDITERKRREQAQLLHNIHLRAALRVGRAVTTLSGLDQVLPRVVELLREQLDYYHVGIFLLDENRESAILRASSSESVKHALENQVRLPLGEISLVSAAIQTAQTRVVQDVAADQGYLFHPQLPDTRSEAVIPLLIGDVAIGALDLQSCEPNAFASETISILTTVADQIAMSVQNARLHTDVAMRARELERAYTALQENQERLLVAEKMASLGRLTAGIAHEMNTPLATARTALVELEKLTEEYQSSLGDAEVTPADHREIARDMQHALALAQHAAERAASFVRSIKFQTRDLAPAERYHFNAVSVIQDTLLLLGYALRRSGCTPVFEPTENNLELVGSPGQLAQVITNLITNAIDASVAKGGGPINLRLNAESDGLRLQVIDHGSGITPENLCRIFDPMFTTKPFGQGTGLGLAIVHDIITGEFGGTIQVTSQINQGTTCNIYFPREVKRDAAQAQN